MKIDSIKLNKAKLAGTLLSLTAVAVALILAISVGLNHTFGWFSNNKEVDADNMSVKAANAGFELAVSGNETLPSYLNNQAIVDYLSEEENGNYENYSSTIYNPSIFCNMVIDPEIMIENNLIAPGSHGYISFDIVVSDGEDHIFDINFGYLPVRVTDGDELETTNDVTVQKLLSGHIFLFTDRTGTAGSYSYSGYINKTMSIQYDTSDPNAIHSTQSDGEHYKIKIYWIWPMTYAHFAFPDGAVGQEAKSVFSSSSERIDLLYNFIKPNNGENADMYFYWPQITSSSSENGQSGNEQSGNEQSGNEQSGSEQSGSEQSETHAAIDYNITNYHEYYYVELSDGYNNGDQHIGDNLRYLVLTVNVNYHESAASNENNENNGN